MCQHGFVQPFRTQQQNRRPATAQRWRWLAHPPYGTPGAPPSPEEADEQARKRRATEEFLRRSDPSPAYGRNPGWGLPVLAAGSAPGIRDGDGPGPADAGTEVPPETPRGVLGRRLDFLDTAARVLLLLGAIAAVLGLGRYVLLVAMRGETVAWWVEAVTSWVTRFAYAASFVSALVLLVAAVRALLAARDLAYSGRGGDPRNTWAMAASGVIPGLNLLYLPVYLREIEPAGGIGRGPRGADPRMWRRLRMCWWILLANQLVGAVYWWQVLRAGTQAAANALILGAIAAALAATIAWHLRRVVRLAHGAAPLRRLTPGAQ